MLGTRPSMSTSIGGIFGVLCRTSAAEGGGATQVMAMVNVLKVGVRVAVRCAGSAGAYPLAWAFDLWTQREVPLLNERVLWRKHITDLHKMLVGRVRTRLRGGPVVYICYVMLYITLVRYLPVQPAAMYSYSY